MTPERWKQIRAVFEEACGLATSDRPACLDRACAGDDDLRSEIESLLRAESQAGSAFLGRPAADLLESNGSVAVATRIGTRIGAYEIVHEIGHGGMGEVYRATRIDGQFDQQVAIKLVRAGMGSALIVDRFRSERQILATLNHPNIARLLDGGATAEGVPYLVMELIDGDRIDSYCQSNRLSVSERLRLFLQVCAAVQYAHQRLVIHRDLKPGNILVTCDGTPKLLDFGIAKLLDPSGESETTMARPMTPEYASPEQIRGEPITTASDVYSLGVVLYQLLTGRSPYRVAGASPAQLSQAIASSDPLRPSTAVVPTPRLDNTTSCSNSTAIASDREPTPARLRKRLSGDIDSILLMALRKEPERRYGSVQQLADDINRHLNGLPVNATRGSWSYVAGKFIRRHRVPVAAAALITLALVAGIAATEHQARIARAERARAQKRFDDVRTFSDSLIFDIHDALQDVPGTTPARKLLLDRASQYLDRVAQDADGDSALQRELAHAYQRLAAVQGDATVSNVGEISASERSSRKALALFEAVARANPANTDDQINVARVHLQKGYSDVYYPEGRPEIEKALEITEPLMRTEGNNPKVLIERAAELQALGDSFDAWGDRPLAAEKIRESLSLVESVAHSDPAYSRIRERLAKNHVKLGFQLAHTPAMDEAQQQIATGLSLYADLLKSGGKTDTIRDLAQSRYRLAFVQVLRGEFDAAAQNFRMAREAEQPLATADPQNMMLRMDIIASDFEMLRILILKGRARDAEPGLTRLIADYEKLNSEENSGPGTEVLYQWLGEAQFAQGKLDAAIKSFRTSIERFQADGSNDDAMVGVMTANVRIGDALLKLHRLTDAETAYKTALSKSDSTLATKRADIPAMIPLAAAHGGVADVKLAAASLTRDAGESGRLVAQACDEQRKAQEISRLTQVKWAFNPTNVPVLRAFPAAGSPAACQ